MGGETVTSEFNAANILTAGKARYPGKVRVVEYSRRQVYEGSISTSNRPFILRDQRIRRSK